MAPPVGAAEASDAPATSLAEADSNEEIFDPRRCDAYASMVKAYVWGKPFVDAAKIRVFFTRPADPLPPRAPSVAGNALNRFGHGRILADPANKSGVGPNNDTLYSNVTFDVTTGPFVVTTPDFGDRYYTFSVAHPDSSTTASYGSRTHGGKLPPLFIHSRGYAGPVPAGMIDIETADRYLHLWGRVLVRSSQDIPAVHKLQDAMKIQRYVDGRLEPVGPPPDQIPFPSGDGARAFLRQLAIAVEDMALSPQDQAVWRRLEPLVEAAQATDWPAGYDTDTIERGLADGKAIVTRAAASFGKAAGGWSVNLAGARFGSDWLLRAAIAKDQIFVTIPEEAIYPIARTAADGSVLDGHNAYRISMTAPPPVRGFWSITLYDDKGAMVANPISRYSVGNRTPGLKFSADEPTEIIISHSRPQEAGAVWLPAPKGPFYLMMRLYGPDKAIQSGQWLPPSIQPSRKSLQ
ncbi:DUF1254 domain-containing protein [Novosphingobium malaysiense]|nr:DUF1214 domain-containing protein [Novosphingobium malaysiense]